MLSNLTYYPEVRNKKKPMKSKRENKKETILNFDLILKKAFSMWTVSRIPVLVRQK